MPNALPESPLPDVNSTVQGLAVRWKCDQQLIYRRIRRGELRAFKVGGLVRIPRAEVLRVEACGPVVDEFGVPTDELEARIAALVENAPPLSDEQRIRISALLLTGTGGAA